MKQTEQTMCEKTHTSENTAYSCIFCDFYTSNKALYARHETTMKHRRALLKQKSTSDKQTIGGAEFVCNLCGLRLKSRTTLWRHHKKCDAEKILDMHQASSQTGDVSGDFCAVSVGSKSAPTAPILAPHMVRGYTHSGAGAGVGVGVGMGEGSDSDTNSDSSDDDSSSTAPAAAASASLDTIMAVEAEMALFTAKNRKPATPDAVLEGQVEVINKFSDMMDMFLSLIKRQDKLIEQNEVIIEQNEVIQNKVIAQQEQLIEIAKRPTTQNNIINNFNILNYLNEEHKDALSIQDFINSIDVTMDDMYYTRDNGYVKGMCNVLVKKIENIPDEYRPIHCTDKKRLKFLVKTKEAWKKDEDNRTIENVMSDITQKHILCLSEWKKLYPDWMKSEELRDEYVKISMQIMDGQRENGEKKKKAIVKTIGSTTHIGGKIPLSQ